MTTKQNLLPSKYVDFSDDVFQDKLLCIKAGKEKDAFNFAVKSIRFVRSEFNYSSDKERLNLVNIYYNASKILIEISNKQTCTNCKKNNLTSAFNTFSTLHNSKSESAELRTKSGEYLCEIFSNLETFYLNNKKEYEASLLKEKFKKSYSRLILASN